MYGKTRVSSCKDARASMYVLDIGCYVLGKALSNLCIAPTPDTDNYLYLEKALLSASTVAPFIVFVWFHEEGQAQVIAGGAGDETAPVGAV